MNKNALLYIFIVVLGFSLSACVDVKKELPPNNEVSLCFGEASITGSAIEHSSLDIDWKPLITSKEDIAPFIASMSLAEKVGQMVQTDIVAATPAEIKAHNIGSIINLTPDGKLGSTQAWRELADSYQLAALQSSAAIPTVFAIDAVHGHSYFDGNSVILPHNIGLGATRNPALVTQLARLTSKELSATGVRWTFSPTIAVAQNIRWGRTYESFGETTELQQMFAVPMVAGYQGEDLSAVNTVGATAKHFIADGATVDGIDRGDALISDAEMRAKHLPGFIDAIERDVVSVMVSFSSINGEKLHGSKALLSDLLKTELGFDGVLVTDWEGVKMSELTLKQGLDAGIDMFMFAQSWKTSLPEIIALVESGQVPVSRIDDAVTRILNMKLKLGLFSKPFSTSECANSVGSEEHRDFAKQAVRESLVLLKNEDAILPLSKSTKVIVVGSHANNIAYQCGGWTKKWQGAHLDLFDNAERPVEGATSIIDGIRNLIGAENVIDAGIDSMSDLADVAIVVVGETPYAEGFGDRSGEELVLSAQNQALIKAYHSAGKKVITLMVSGRPMLVNEQIDQSAAFVAVWLPGSEGQGIAEVLFGEANFSGKLGFSWPGDVSQIGIHQDDANYAPRYPYGYGLRY